MAIPFGKGAVGLAVYRREPVKVLDAVASMAVVSDPTLTMQKRSMLEALISRYRSLLAVPLIIKDEIYGAITLYYQSFREFTDEEISLVVSFADQAALAIENARLREQAEQAAVVAERSRLARDLHDAVTQSLYSVTLYAEAAVRLLNAGDHTTAANHLRELRDTAQEALREMRLLIFELRPLALEKSGLAAALQARLEAVEGRTGIQVDLNVVGAEYADGLPYGVQEELYHISQEALNNVLKHAHARHVHVSLSVSESATCLEISDDGVSFEPARAEQAGGLGLAGMKERAQKIGGTVDFACVPGQGTKIIITVPVSASATPTIPKTTQPRSQTVGG
jgi:signal transduction histidine kinase